MNPNSDEKDYSRAADLEELFGNQVDEMLKMMLRDANVIIFD